MFTQTESWYTYLLIPCLINWKDSGSVRSSRMWHKPQCFLFPPGLETVTSDPGMPVKCLTSNLLQSRRRLATSSASSQSHTFLSSVESECHSSPRWEKDCQVRGTFIWTQANFMSHEWRRYFILFCVNSVRKWNLGKWQSR